MTFINFNFEESKRCPGIYVFVCRKKLKINCFASDMVTLLGGESKDAGY